MDNQQDASPSGMDSDARTPLRHGDEFGSLGSSTGFGSIVPNEGLLLLDPASSVDQGNDCSSDEGDATKATMLSSVCNLSNTIIGSGTLAMPFACMKSGVVLFIIMLIGTALMADYAIRILFETVEMLDLRPAEYPEIGKRLFGRKGELIASWSVTLQQFGACIAYVVLIADVCTPVVSLGAQDSESMLCNRALLQIAVVVLIIFPLCLLKSMDSLKYTSSVALACIIAFIAVVCPSSYLFLYLSILPSQYAHHIYCRSLYTVSKPCSIPRFYHLLAQHQRMCVKRTRSQKHASPFHADRYRYFRAIGNFC